MFNKGFETATVFVVVIILVGAGRVDGGVFNELGDAGQLPGTANDTLAVSVLDSISGTIDVFLQDADMYKIQITDEANFSASIIAAETVLSVPRLYLFDSLGKGVSFNANSNGTAAISSSNVTSNGLYYLAVSPTYYYPQDATNTNIFPTVFNAEVAPDLNTPIAGWQTGGGIGTAEGNYIVRLTGVNTVPEPTTLILAALSLLGIGCHWRKRA